MSQSGAISTGGEDPGIIKWNEITVAGPTQMVNANGYVANAGVLVRLTLPAAADLGEMVAVVGKGAGLYRIEQNAGQQIHYGNLNTTAGVGGSVTSTLARDTIWLLCTTTNTNWTVCTGTTGIHNVV